jgi:hypothetical protein
MIFIGDLSVLDVPGGFRRLLLRPKAISPSLSIGIARKTDRAKSCQIQDPEIKMVDVRKELTSCF